jgi:hypothetical protein
MYRIYEQIDDLKKRSSHILSERRMAKVELYCEGLKAKLSQIEYSLYRIDEFNNRSDKTESTTDTESPSITIQVNFYCDTFWTFLYSSLDVLSQIINQVMKLNLDERQVAFKNLHSKLKEVSNDNKLISQHEQCCKSRPFKNLDKYRNCSLHRRHIYTEEQCLSSTVTRSAGYSIGSTEDTSNIVKRLICDDPYDPKPKLTQERAIPDYMIETKAKIYKYIIEILKATAPIQ